MSFLSPVPSQKDAVRYIDTTVQRSEGKLILGGHSKGGNLAVYASVFARPSVKKRIITVYNNDGPGFDSNFVKHPDYLAILPRIKSIVPYCSVVGMLLNHDGDYEVVKSSQSGLMQHDSMSWQVIGPDFETEQECFENDGKGTFRYMTDGKPMKIEVPSDKYDEAVMAMEEKIKNGQVKGVSDPNEAKNIVKKGHFTYAQAKNIAKAGTVESLTYDAVNGTIIASSAFGVTAMITFATSMWNGEDFEDAIKIATYSGLKVGGTAFITSVLAAQLSKAGLNSALVGSSEAIVAMMGPKASAVLINAFRIGSKPIYGAAAMKAAAKLLRSNTITAGITFVVLSSFDVANIFRGRISGKQLFKNMANTAATVGAGTGGWVAGAAIGSAIPGIGTIVGGLVGSMVAGSAAGKVTNAVVGSFIEDDADKMVEIIQDVFTEMASEYLLSNKEAEKSVDRLKDKLDGKTLKDMFASNDRKKFARNLLIPIIENQISKREVIHKLTEEQMLYGIREVLEDISDMEESYA